ncbi:hypothetical protein K0M31_004507 [Melipona bicolor]|uniref:Uncharacterized protein n=1 Tax=Melipona bicolor TaxID=60889 RepID=A0AA40FXD8_9HYME|nr:hypothetical protein K0M31_004507 [Melipona bicolor]
MDRRGDEEAGNFALVEYGEATGLSIAPKRRAFNFARVPLSWKSNLDDDDDDDDDDGDDDVCPKGDRPSPRQKRSVVSSLNSWTSLARRALSLGIDVE